MSAAVPEEGAGEGIGLEDQTTKDRSYSPASETEIEQRQESPSESHATDDLENANAVETLPGTGGPDDNGSVDVPDEELNVPRDTGAH